MSFKDIHAFQRSGNDDVESILAVLVNPETESLPDEGPTSVGVHPKHVNDDVEEDIIFNNGIIGK